MKIVPGIRSIELLPAHLQNDQTYVFSGPLLLEDFMMGEVGLSNLRDLDKSLMISLEWRKDSIVPVRSIHCGNIAVEESHTP